MAGNLRCERLLRAGPVWPWGARVVALVALLGGGVILGEEGAGKANQARQEISQAEWDHRVELILGSGVTAVKQLELLREAATKVSILHQGKILDIEPAGGGALRIRVVPVLGGDEFPPFHVSAAAAHLVKEWDRWDRLAWLALPRVHAIGDIRFELVYAGPGDLRRTPNPGVTFPTFKKAPIEFPRWYRLMRRYLRDRNYAGAWRLLKRYMGKAFPCPGTITRPARGCVTVVWPDESMSDVTIRDPQLFEMIESGQVATFAILLTTPARNLGEFAEQEGPWDYRVEFWHFGK